MNGTPKARRDRGPVTGFLMPAIWLVLAALYLTGVIDVQHHGWIGALFVAAAVIGAALQVLRLRRARLERGQQ
ncbi:hypothetical protein [uncultured Brachybacterium sp.]|uniref:hypothetical protein n=1 Tax=uncultured Brachybacterium sp. TaxID=189680 RepID=UPI0026330129|nr:hypothetical protein [uncultured Brachybacterium sp.]